MTTWSVIHGDVVHAMGRMATGSVSSIVGDPPGARKFRGLKWDGAKGGRNLWVAWMTGVMREALRVAEPGAYATIWTLPRTSHWTRYGIEDGGWEIVGDIAHIQSQGKRSSPSLPRPCREDWVIARAPGPLRPLQDDAVPPAGKEPTNIIVGHSDGCGDVCAPGCAVAMLDAQGGVRKSGARRAGVRRGMGYGGAKGDGGPAIQASEGYVSRFFYCPKLRGAARRDADHLCAKPLPLMEYIVGLTTPPGGNVLELFSGSGQGGIVCGRLGHDYTGIDFDKHHVATARRRIAAAQEKAR